MIDVAMSKEGALAQYLWGLLYGGVPRWLVSHTDPEASHEWLLDHQTD